MVNPSTILVAMASSGDQKQAGPTELESCVLAIIERRGACTAYAVRRYLAASLSSYWSGSAGAIYPLLRKLVRAGWADFEETPFGTRKRRVYRVTSKGNGALGHWLSAPIPDGVAAYTHDPLRARVFFLDLVPPRERRAFLDDAIAQTKSLLALHQEEREELASELDDWDLHGREGAIRELSARLDWLRGVRRALPK